MSEDANLKIFIDEMFKKLYVLLEVQDRITYNKRNLSIGGIGI